AGSAPDPHLNGDAFAVLAEPDRLVLPEHAVPPKRGPQTALDTLRATSAKTQVVALTTLGLALRLALIGAQSLRLDESLSLSQVDRKSTRLNSSHVAISYAVFCLKKKKITKT